MSSIIKIEGQQWIGEVANNLIDKLSEAIGWVATQKTDKQKAKEVLINDLQSDSNLSHIEKYAMISNINRITKEYCNQYDIVAKSVSYLKSDNEINKLSDDFLLLIMNKFSNVSDDDFQDIWARVLAQECNLNRSIPKSLFFIIEKMDKEDAISFMNLCKFVVKIGDKPSLVVDKRKLDYYFNNGLSYNSFVKLDKLGLIEKNFSQFSNEYCDELGVNTISYGMNEHEMPEECKEFYCGAAIFTREGEALYKSVDSGVIDGFWEEIVIPRIEFTIQRSREIN